MEIPAEFLLQRIDFFILVFVRMTGLFVVAPIFGRRNIPAYLKVAFSFMMSLIVINTVSATQLDYVQNAPFLNTIIGFGVLVFKEMMVGITLGYVSFLVFTAIYLAGQLIDMQVGFGIVSVLDPTSNIQVPITANFYYILSMMIFLLMDGHHVLIQALFHSYQVIPVGGAVFTENLLNDILRIFSNTFIIGFKISAPVLAAILVTDVALGVISKTIPQMNIFVVGMPLKIFMGLAIIVITIPVFAAVTDFLMSGMANEMYQFIKDMAAP